ncbi:MAG TPA: hypothetical protein VGC81_08655 [Candidatus Methylomirabilis sp.]
MRALSPPGQASPGGAAGSGECRGQLGAGARDRGLRPARPHRRPDDRGGRAHRRAARGPPRHRARHASAPAPVPRFAGLTPP